MREESDSTAVLTRKASSRRPRASSNRVAAPPEQRAHGHKSHGLRQRHRRDVVSAGYCLPCFGDKLPLPEKDLFAEKMNYSIESKKLHNVCRHVDETM